MTLSQLLSLCLTFPPFKLISMRQPEWLRQSHSPAHPIPMAVHFTLPEGQIYSQGPTGCTLASSLWPQPYSFFFHVAPGSPTPLGPFFKNWNFLFCPHFLSLTAAFLFLYGLNHLLTNYIFCLFILFLVRLLTKMSTTWGQGFCPLGSLLYPAFRILVI